MVRMEHLSLRTRNCTRRPLEWQIRMRTAAAVRSAYCHRGSVRMRPVIVPLIGTVDGRQDTTAQVADGAVRMALQDVLRPARPRSRRTLDALAVREGHRSWFRAGKRVARTARSGRVR